MRKTPTSAEIKGTMTRKEFDELTPELSPEHREMLWGMVNNPHKENWPQAYALAVVSKLRT